MTRHTAERAGIYCRISKDDAGTTLGVKRQEKLCRQLAGERGVAVERVFVDNDMSASSGKRRPAFEALLEAVESGEIDTVICWHVDRLYRRNVELERIVSVVEHARLSIFTVMSSDIDLRTASGRMLARMLGAAAQGEVERMGERVRAKLAELAAAGRPPGGRAPYGYDVNRSIVESEARWIRLAAERLLDGWSTNALVADLAQMGATARGGRPFMCSHLKRVLTNPAVAGLRVHQREIVGEGQWEPIIDRQTWERVCAVLADPARRRTGPQAGAKYEPYLLSGIVRSHKGDTMYGCNRRDRLYMARTLTGREPVQAHVAITASKLEPHVVAAVLKRSDDVSLDVEPDASPIESEIEQIEAEIEQLTELRRLRKIGASEWLAIREGLDDALRTARASAPRRPTQTLTSAPLRSRWDDLTITQQQTAVREFIDYVEVRPTRQNRWARLEDRVTIHWRM